MIGDILWTPRPDWRDTTEIGRFMTWLRDERGRELSDYDELWRWSVIDLEGFWGALWDFYGIRTTTPYERVLGKRTMPGAEWFTGARLNYAEHLVGRDADLDRVAVVARSQTRAPRELTFGDVRELAGRVRAGLQRLGVRRGDRVVAYMPNIPETLAAFIATASLGAVWATCAPEFGARSVVGRFGQVEPRVLLTVGGYGYRDRYADRRAEVAAIRSRLPTLQHVVTVPYGDAQVPEALDWEELTAQSAPLEFDPVDFNHPLYILFSSGTTGLPKPIVHGHGGQLIEHHKNLGLGWDLKPGGRLLWFSTTAWMMWNALVSALLLRSSIVMLDGDPAWPDLLEQWRLADALKPSVMGVSPAYLMACRKAGLEMGRECDLSSIRAVRRGIKLPSAGYRYDRYEQLGSRAAQQRRRASTARGGLASSPSPCTGRDHRRVLASPSPRSTRGRRRPVAARPGDPPLPSIPSGSATTPEARYRCSTSVATRACGATRLDQVTERVAVITGRSDATLNRGGVRLGTGEFYAVVEDIPEIFDALVIHLEDGSGGGGELLLFVVPGPDAVLDDGLRDRIAKALRAELSPRHVPDQVILDVLVALGRQRRARGAQHPHDLRTSPLAGALRAPRGRWGTRCLAPTTLRLVAR